MIFLLNQYCGILTIPLLYKAFIQKTQEQDPSPKPQTKFDIRLKTHLEASQAQIQTTLKDNTKWDNVQRTSINSIKVENKLYIIEQLKF